MELDEKLERLKTSFSNNQKKLFQRIEPITNRQVAISLISLQGVEKTSQTEIEVIANLISQFQPLEIVDFHESPRRVVLRGKVSKGHVVYIEPQYKVANRNPKAQPWAIDLVLTLFRKIDRDLTEIASIGVEYDGHISHYVESKVKSTYKREVSIVSDTGIQTLRVSPELWKSDAESIKKAIKKYFKRCIKIIDNVQLSTINAQNEFSSTTTCPICNGRCRLAEEDCPACNGMGAVKESVAEKLDLSDYEEFKCHDCRGISLDCHTCGGSGTISREKALEL